MKPTRAFSTGALALLLSLASAQAEILLRFTTAAATLQTSAFRNIFLGGELNVNMHDGEVTLAQCLDHPSQVIVAPYIFCPLGTTGFIASGDVDGDGVRDDLSFWSVSDVIPALVIEPFRPELCQLNSAPPSMLPRPLRPFQDFADLVFYNVLTANVLQYDITDYELTRPYPAGEGGRAQMKRELVVGSYVFTFPRLNFPDTAAPVAIPVTYRSIPTAFDVTERYPEGGFRFTSGTWDGNGNYLMDPRIITEIAWSGNRVDNTFQAVDVFRLSIVDQMANPQIETVLFPPSATPLLLPNSLTQSYLLPPFFFEVGDVGVFRLRIDRTLGTSIVAFDTSTRLFHFNIRFVDSYNGFKVLAFPADTVEQLRHPNADFDKDGQTNLHEFGMQSDPADAGEVAPDPVSFPNLDGTISYTVSKRPDSVLVYSFSVSKNGGKFVVIKANNPEWEITVNDQTTLTITTRQPANAADYAAKNIIREIPLR